MKSYRMNAVLVGVLYVIGTIAGISSLVVTRNLFAGEDYLTRIAANPFLLHLGALFVLIMGISLATMPIFLYPLFKKKNEALALGMVIFRGPIEASGYFLSVVNWLLLVVVSKEFMAAGSDIASLQTIGNVMVQFDGRVGPALSILFIIGAMFLYILFYSTKLIPIWISLWGMFGAVLYITYYLMKFFDLNLNLGFLILPLAIQEMVMGFWLIFKGFRQTAIDELMTNK
jgi:hypothetical protein